MRKVKVNFGELRKSVVRRMDDKDFVLARKGDFERLKVKRDFERVQTAADEARKLVVDLLEGLDLFDEPVASVGCERALTCIGDIRKNIAWKLDTLAKFREKVHGD